MKCTILEASRRTLSVALLWIASSGWASAQEVSQAECGDISLYGLSNSYWNLEVAPELGGKIVSLYDQRAQREWMWSQDVTRSLVLQTEGAVFGDENLLGMDEILPSLHPEEWQAYSLPGFGEVWRSQISVNEEALLDGVVETQLKLQSLPLMYTRRLSLSGRQVQMEYILKNLADQPVPFLWAQHPLFTISEGDRFTADFDGAPLRVVVAPGLDQLSAEDLIDWPGLAAGLDLSKLSLGSAPKAGLKLYTVSPVDGFLALSNPDTKARLEIRYEVENLPWLAVWISRGVWGGAHHIVIEPTNRPNEKLEMTDDVQAGDAWSGSMQPGEIRRWIVTFTNASP